MNEFAIVSEGQTDYQVLRNILLGWFKGQSAEPLLNPYQPNPTAEGESSWQKFGNWENVLRYLREKKHRDALEFADFLVVQIDTDQSEHSNFGVSQRDGNQHAEPLLMVARVVAFLQSVIGPEDTEFYGSRIIFAICVREIECWLLPLWDLTKAAKCEGCLDTLNRSLASADETTINPEDKCPALYSSISRGYKKRKTLILEGRKNPSLSFFLDELERRSITLQTE